MAVYDTKKTSKIQFKILVRFTAVFMSDFSSLFPASGQFNTMYFLTILNSYHFFSFTRHLYSFFILPNIFFFRFQFYNHELIFFIPFYFHFSFTFFLSSSLVPLIFSHLLSDSNFFISINLSTFSSQFSSSDSSFVFYHSISQL